MAECRHNLRGQAPARAPRQIDLFECYLTVDGWKNGRIVNFEMKVK